MFEFFFNFPSAAFSKGQFVLLGRWPVWVLALAIVAAALALGWPIFRLRFRADTPGADGGAPATRGLRPVVIWLLQTALVALVLVLLWQPALRISTLKPQQNVVAVVVDDSRSMSIVENGTTRSQQAVKVLNGGLLASLAGKFQVRLYRLGENLQRMEKLDELTTGNGSTHIGENLKQVVAEAASLPIGAVVLLSDGADNSGGIGLETIAEIRGHRIPVHTIGFGREEFAHDLEVTDVQVPARALADSRLAAQVTLRQHGYTNSKARLTLKEGGKTLASKEITLKGEGKQQIEPVLFNAGIAGAKHLQISVDPLEGEENPNNNKVARLVNVEATKPRILYMEGEPRWEFKFIRRALEDDRSVQLVTILRTTQNKIYRQGISNPKELEEGFPARVEELFDFQGLVIGSVEATYFTPTQQELIRQFVDRRGGGLLFLGGRVALEEGGYGKSEFADLLPVTLPDRKGTYHRDPAGVELTGAGSDSLLTRLEEDPAKNVERWRKLPKVADYQEIGTPKPGAVVLAEMVPPGRGRLPLLVTENYGRGRTAVFATGGSWRWQMLQELSDKTHEMFWQQMLRWLVTGTPGHVLASTPKQVLSDESRVHLTAEVRDKTYLPMMDARVEARILGPGGASDVVEMIPDPLQPGVYSADWRAERAGSFVAEVMAKRGEEEVGRDVLTFQREDGVAENFHAEQNRELLEKLSAQTGGNYYRPNEASKLSEEIAYSEAGITVRETKDLWNMPAIFLLVILLCATEWLLRRKWGAV